jgi:hypothetical protein
MPDIPIRQPELSLEEALDLLLHGTMDEIHGLLPWGSNRTFLATISKNHLSGLVVYKPQKGERPLWDFTDGSLCLRERAAFVVSEALGWHIVPPTVLRTGKYGPGSVQWFVSHDPEANYFTFGPAYTDQLKRMALFDVVINNADRKGGHCLLDPHDHIWAIDHGVCFHPQPKLRTVIWDYAGEPIPDHLMGDLSRLCEDLAGGGLLSELRNLLSRTEISALRLRVERALDEGTFPFSGPGRSYPWPPV